MDIAHALILSVIEGITEFLPVSSTGHMILASRIMNIPQTEFLKTFEIAIQLGAILAVVGMYWRVFLLDWAVVRRVLAAFVPTAVVGFLLYKTIKAYLLGNVLVVAWSLFIGGALLILFELYYQPKKEPVKSLEKITYGQAVLIGLCQSLAVVPGVSRSAATILGGLMLGVERTTIVEFSFLLAVPTMMAATLLDLIMTEAVLTKDDWGLLAIGFFGAMVVAYCSVKFLLAFVKKHNFISFGVYRILAAGVFMWWMTLR